MTSDLKILITGHQDSRIMKHPLSMNFQEDIILKTVLQQPKLSLLASSSECVQFRLQIPILVELLNLLIFS